MTCIAGTRQIRSANRLLQCFVRPCPQLLYKSATRLASSRGKLPPRFCITLLGGLAIPHFRRMQVFCDSIAAGIKLAKVVLGSGIALRCRLLVPLRRSNGALHNAPTCLIHLADVGLRACIPMSRGLPVPLRHFAAATRTDRTCPRCR